MFLSYLVLVTCNLMNRVDGAWTIFTGDQLGSIFAARILEQYKTSGKPLGRSLAVLPPARRADRYLLREPNGPDKLSMIASAVSSKIIEAMAAAEGFNFTECLTGLYLSVVHFHVFVVEC